MARDARVRARGAALGLAAAGLLLATAPAGAAQIAGNLDPERGLVMPLDDVGRFGPLVPVPEPEPGTLALVALGAAALGRRRR